MFLGVASDGGNGHDLVSNTIPANGSKKVLFRPLTSAVLSMSKFLPALLLNQGMTIELELDDAANSMAQSNGVTTYSQTFQLEDCRCLTDSIVLTSELQDQYTSLLLSGKSLYIDLPTLSDNTLQYVPGNHSKFSINSSRQYSRLNTLIITFCQDSVAGGLVEKDVNNFYLPASSEDIIESNLVINGVRSPAFNNTGVRQHWNRMLRGVGAYASVGTSTSISATGFGLQAGAATVARSFSVLFDLEK
jgi:hypothetical protein